MIENTEPRTLVARATLEIAQLAGSYAQMTAAHALAADGALDAGDIAMANRLLAEGRIYDRVSRRLIELAAQLKELI